MGCCNTNNRNSEIELRCLCSRYVDVPMSVVRGQGYTELDCCEDTHETLQEISNTLKRLVPRNNNRCECNCCEHNCCNNCCECNRCEHNCCNDCCERDCCNDCCERDCCNDCCNCCCHRRGFRLFGFFSRNRCC